MLYIRLATIIFSKMGKRTSFIRIDKNHLPSDAGGKDWILDQVFNPDVKDASIVVDMDKSLQALFFIIGGRSVAEAAAGLVSEWEFTALYEGDIHVYYQESQQVQRLNDQLSAIDQGWLAKHYNAEALKENNIYPEIWDEQHGYEGLQYLSDRLGSLRNFYKQAVQRSEVVIAVPT